MRASAILILAIACLPGVEEGRRLLWADEFDKPGAPDPALWSYEVGLVRNKERQYYTSDRRENARVEDGMLILEARKESFQGADYTSASLHTNGKRDLHYGRIEIRAKLATGRGVWPALWTLGTNIGTAGWPRCGEIDIMEHVGFDPDGLHCNVHTQTFNHMHKTNKGRRMAIKGLAHDFRVFAVEWTAKDIAFSCDGQEVFRFADDGKGEDHWPFDKPQYLLMNVAIGGSWGGQQGIDDAALPARMLVDWVRVYAPKP